MLLSTGAMVAQYIGQTVNLALKKTGALLQQLLIVYKKM